MQHWIYFIPLLAIAYLFWSRRSASATDLQALLAKGAQIVDVRTKAEFQSQSHPRSKNIPLDQLGDKLKSLDKTKPVLVCCASGSRSAVAVGILKKAGFSDVANIGAWTRIASLVS
jgi:rhodanese-related sulfurtransferase